MTITVGASLDEDMCDEIKSEVEEIRTSRVGFFEGEGEGSVVVGESDGAGLGLAVTGEKDGSAVTGEEDGLSVGYGLGLGVG